MTTNIQQKDGKYVVKLVGELDTLTAPTFQQDLAPLSQKQEPLQVEFDLSQLNYVASKGLRVFLSFYQDVLAKGGSVIVTAITDTVKEVFDLTGFSGIFKVA